MSIVVLAAETTEHVDEVLNWSVGLGVLALLLLLLLGLIAFGAGREHS